MGIVVEITASGNKDQSSARVSGSEIEVISSANQDKFDLGDSNLKKAVDKYFGKKPNDAFLHSPTPWDDLYKRYNWSQVQTHLVPQSAEVTEITSEPVILATKVFENKSSSTGTFSGGISDSVTNSVSNSWSNSDSVSVGQKISYKASFIGGEVGGETSFSYTQTWGESKTESKSVTVGTTSDISVVLKPGESVKAQLTASRGVMKVRVTYKMYLTGLTAINYNPTYKGHHFWGLDINQVLSAAGMAVSKTITEDLEIGYYSDSKIVLIDNQEKTLMTHSLMNFASGPLNVAELEKKAA